MTSLKDEWGMGKVENAITLVVQVRKGSSDRKRIWGHLQVYRLQGKQEVQFQEDLLCFTHRGLYDVL